MALTKTLNLSRQLSTKVKDLDFNGVIVAITTPFKENYDISFDNLKSNLIKYEQIPFKGYLIAGTNGEAPFLSAAERVSLVKAVRGLTKRMIVGGSTAESTKATCLLTSEMRDAGADAVLVMPPFYFRKKMTDEALEEHYITVADTCATPIILYNNPFVSGIDLSISLITKLAKHPLIVGVKDSDIRKSAVIIENCKGCNFHVLTASAGYLVGGLLNGCTGGMVGLAGILGDEVCQIYTLCKEGKIKEASELQRRICKPDSMLLAEFGVPALKAALDMMGYYGGVCRPPMLPLPEPHKQQIKQTLQEAGFLKA
ncbi:hypothetical protein O3M35_000593 [Rhynocoris fuscipes]|uniref:4-hydroxy-2-oxoglutarate aldolase, mitochondrial n=1 Tax=Rhynocoris fuscipes TaxID=488301 RepID=A0AAW1DM64_9HEMI